MTPLPMIHVYCFQNPDVASDMILKEVREALGYEIEERELTLHNVRNVAPKKVRANNVNIVNIRICIAAPSDFHQK